MSEERKQEILSFLFLANPSALNQELVAQADTILSQENQPEADPGNEEQDEKDPEENQQDNEDNDLKEPGNDNREAQNEDDPVPRNEEEEEEEEEEEDEEKEQKEHDMVEQILVLDSPMSAISELPLFFQTIPLPTPPPLLRKVTNVSVMDHEEQPAPSPQQQQEEEDDEEEDEPIQIDTEELRRQEELKNKAKQDEADAAFRHRREDQYKKERIQDIRERVETLCRKLHKPDSYIDEYMGGDFSDETHWVLLEETLQSEDRKHEFNQNAKGFLKTIGSILETTINNYRFMGITAHGLTKVIEHNYPLVFKRDIDRSSQQQQQLRFFNQDAPPQFCVAENFAWTVGQHLLQTNHEKIMADQATESSHYVSPSQRKSKQGGFFQELNTNKNKKKTTPGKKSSSSSKSKKSKNKNASDDKIDKLIWLVETQILLNQQLVMQNQVGKNNNNNNTNTLPTVTTPSHVVDKSPPSNDLSLNPTPLPSQYEPPPGFDPSDM